MKKRSRVDIVRFIIFLTIIGVSIIILLMNLGYIKELNIDKVITYVQEQGALAGVVYLGIYMLKPFFLIIPANIVAIAGGIVFGPVKGFILAMIGFFVSGTVAFYIARFLGRDFVESIVGKRVLELDRNLEEKGFKILFLLRLPPVLPFDPLSYACGLTKIKYKDFILASLLGVVPETICYSVLGRSFSNPLSWQFLLPIVIIIIGTLFSKKIMDFGQKNKS